MLKRLALPLATASAVAIAAGTVGYFEGKENSAYIDPVGVVTICYGHTSTARIGQTHSDAECERLLQQDLGEAFEAVERHVDAELPPTREAALASFVYNVGEGAFARSTLLRRLNAGQVQEACDELLRWVYAGGRVLRGLVTRRQAERELCLMEPEHILAGESHE
ncbi:lysozyme [Halomonas sp. DX6]|uniref:Lysozyme n=1 Tax=Billgrantia bachuensis TaxID=2717286 RepID=A0ABX0PPZ1_9GAMM|nr:lysozyme [Halomonas bachuensis]